jgi:DNA invertase Pin-like site-specific DNA recombinase
MYDPPLNPMKITPHHLQHQAIVYIRQSSPKQVCEHAESQRNQRALVERARELGWPLSQITVLDGDLGQSARSTVGREDFTSLTVEVALGHVGIIFGWEVSRLARNNADWYHVLASRPSRGPSSPIMRGSMIHASIMIAYSWD